MSRPETHVNSDNKGGIDLIVPRSNGCMTLKVEVIRAEGNHDVGKIKCIENLLARWLVRAYQQRYGGEAAQEEAKVNDAA